MKKQLFLLLLCAININVLYAQDDKFGDKMLDWVNNEAHAASYNMADADFKFRWANDFLAFHQKAYQFTDSLNNAVKAMYEHIRVTDSTYQNYPVVQAAILRKKDATELIQQLMGISDKVDYIYNRIIHYDSLASRRYFVDHGLYHVGRTSLMESFVDATKNQDALIGQYGFAVKLTVDANGNSTFDTSVGRTSDAEAATETTVLAGSAYVPGGIAVGAAAVGLYNLGKFIFALNEHEKQVAKLQEALALLPTKFITTEESYKLYSNYYYATKNIFLKTTKTLDSVIINEKVVIKQLYAFNAARTAVSDNILTAAKIKSIQDQYLQGNADVTSIFDNYALISLSTDVSHLTAQQDSLKFEAEIRPNSLTGIRTVENYEDALNENRVVLNTLKNNTKLIPYWQELEKRLNKIQVNLASVSNLYKPLTAIQIAKRAAVKRNIQTSNTFFNDAVFVKAALNAAAKEKVINSNLKANQKILQAYTKIAARTTNSGVLSNKKAAVELSRNLSKQPAIAMSFINHTLRGNMRANLDGGGYCMAYFNGNTFTCGIGMGGPGSYQGGFSTQNGFPDVLGSRFDGGRNADGRVATMAVDAMRQNMDSRLKSVVQQYSALQTFLPSWQTSNSQVLNTMNADITQLEITSKNRYDQFMSQNAAALRDAKQAIGDFLAQDLNTAAVEKFKSTFGISGKVLTEIPPSQIRPDGYVIQQNNFREEFYKGQSAEQRPLTHEKLKENAQFVQIEKRVLDNMSANQRDPVFDDVHFFYDLRFMASSYLLNAERCLDPTYGLINRDPGLAASMCKNYMDAAQKIRYYAQGYLKDYATPEKYFIDGVKLREEILPALAPFAQCPNEAGSALDKSACNRFTSKAVEKIYGVMDFHNPADGDDDDPALHEKFYTAAKIENYISQSPKWHLLGTAEAQEVLTKGASLASQGHAVIAIKIDDPERPNHVCVFLPGTPTERSGMPNWSDLRLPYVANYGLVAYPPPNFELSIKLSYAFRSPEGVLIYYRDYP